MRDLGFSGLHVQSRLGGGELKSPLAVRCSRYIEFFKNKNELVICFHFRSNKCFLFTKKHELVILVKKEEPDVTA